MITELRLQDFKNFKDATLRLGPFTVVVGANASGKSNIRDAFRFLHGVGRGYSLADIIGGKYGAGGQSEWAPLRGAANEIVRFGETAFKIDVKLEFPAERPDEEKPLPAEYSVGVEKIDRGRGGFRVASEELKVLGETIFSSAPGFIHSLNLQIDPEAVPSKVNAAKDKFVQSLQRTLAAIATEYSGQPALSLGAHSRALSPEHEVFVTKVLDGLAGMQFLDLVPDQMRKPAFPGQTVLGDSGENLPSVLNEICLAPDRKAILIDWIQELTPLDVVDFEFPRDPSGLIHLVLKERSGIAVSAYSASDGTLRFLALLAALFGTHSAKLYFCEEIETGVHPSRLRLLLDLVERQTAKNGIQVIATTHSPDLLQMIGDSTFNYTSVVYRPRDTDQAIIRPVADLPNARRLRAEQGLGPLHASGWMEDVLFFNEDNEQTAAK